MTDLSQDGALLVEPPIERWEAIAAHTTPAPAEAALADAAASFRAELGLPGDRPIVMSGHQAGFWHPGIVAKYLATQATAGWAEPVWLIADLDANQPTRVRIPKRDQADVVRSELHELALGSAGHPDAATGFRPAVAVADDLPGELEPVAAALRRAAVRSQTLAEQVHAAASTVLEEKGAGRIDRTISAHAIMHTQLFQAIVDRMRDEPARCVEAYNDAVRAEPDAGVRLLSFKPGRWELPLWRVGPNEPRMPVMFSAGEQLRSQTLAPRGLLMTGLLRAAACDLFIHGTGGGNYDNITQRWLGEWLGLTLRPAAVVSATILLDFSLQPISPAAAAQDVARAHRARHDPALLGDRRGATEKQDLVRRIQSLPRHSLQRAELFNAMHALLERARTQHAAELAALDEQAHAARAALRSREAILDRTWPFFLYEREQFVELRDRLETPLRQRTP